MSVFGLLPSRHFVMLDEFSQGHGANCLASYTGEHHSAQVRHFFTSTLAQFLHVGDQIESANAAKLIAPQQFISQYRGLIPILPKTEVELRATRLGCCGCSEDQVVRLGARHGEQFWSEQINGLRVVTASDFVLGLRQRILPHLTANRGLVPLELNERAADVVSCYQVAHTSFHVAG